MMTISKDFKMFVPGRKRGILNSTAKPLASVCGSGMLRFNAAAKEAYDLTNETHVVAFYSAEKKILGLKIVKPGTRYALKFYDLKDDTNPCLGIKKLLEDFGLGNVTQSARETAFVEDENMILIYEVEQFDDNAPFERAISKARRKKK